MLYKCVFILLTCGIDIGPVTVYMLDMRLITLNIFILAKGLPMQSMYALAGNGLAWLLRFEVLDKCARLALSPRAQIALVCNTNWYCLLFDLKLLLIFS